MKFISSAKLVVCGNLPNISGVFLKEESKYRKVPWMPLSFRKFKFGMKLVAYVNNYVDFCV